MPGAVPQVPRRMGIGRGLRTSCTNNRSPTSPNVGLQQQSSFSVGNAAHGGSQDSEADSDRVVLQKRFQKLTEADHATHNPSSTQTNYFPGELMYTISAQPEVGAKLVGLLVDRNQNPGPVQMIDPVFCEGAAKTFHHDFLNGSIMRQPEGTFQLESEVVEVRDIEAEQLEKSKMGKTLLEHLSTGHMNQDARDRRKAAFARFLRPALLQAQVDRKNRIAIDPPNGSKTEFVNTNESPTPSLEVPKSAAEIEEQSLMKTTVSSELSNGHGPGGSGGGSAGNDPHKSTMEERVVRAFKALYGKAGEKPVSIPTPSVSHHPISSAQATSPSSNPVTIQPMPDIETVRTKAVDDGTFGRTPRVSPNSVRGPRPNQHKSKGPHGALEQECIKKKRRYAVGEWKSFLIKNFCAEDENSIAIWIVEAEESQDLDERLRNIDLTKPNPLAIHMLGGAAMIKREEKFLRVTITDLRSKEATVLCVDSGDKIDASVTDLYLLPQALKSIPPLAMRVIVESDRITNAKRFEVALQLAKDHQTVTQGCALTWDFNPKFVFRLPGCRALAVSKEPISPQWHQNSLHSGSTEQRLYRDLPGIHLPASGSTVKQCLVTHVDGTTIYITWEDLHNFALDTAVEDLPLKYEVGEMCVVPTDAESGTQLRCCIESIQEETAWVRWIDCGTLFEVAREYLLPLPAHLIYPPGAVKATLANFTSEDVESAGDDLSQVLLSLKDLKVFFLDLKSVPRVIIFTESFTEVKLETLENLRTLYHEDPVDATGDELEAQEPAEIVPEPEEIQPESEPPQDAFVVGIAAFSQVWVVPKESMAELEDMENRLTRSKPADLRDCEPETLCAAMHENRLRRALVRLRIGKRFMVRLVDRALDISATRVFNLPDEFRDFPTPCYCIGLCPQQIKDVHFGRFISALKRHPEVALLPPSIPAETNTDSASVSGSEYSSQEAVHRVVPPKYFLTTREGEDIMTAYGIREQPQ